MQMERPLAAPDQAVFRAGARGRRLPLYCKQQRSAAVLNMHGHHLVTVPEDRVC